jgi:hypothetical protein
MQDSFVIPMSFFAYNFQAELGRTNGNHYNLY